MKKFFNVVICLVLASLLLVSCSNQTNTENNNQNSTTAKSNETVTEEYVDDPESQSNKTTESFQIIDASGNKIEGENNVYTISNSGEYTASGLLEEGQILISAGENDEVKLILSDVSITNSSNAPIVALTLDKLTINVLDGTYNTLDDLRTSTEVQYDGCIYAECDLDLSGKGTLIVTSSCENGIKTKDDLDVKNLTLKVTAVMNALKGNDSVTIESGSLILISSSDDGIKTSNSDVSTKNNQKGTVSILGGNVDIYSYADGIDASYDVNVSGDATLNVNTGKYSNYSSAQSSSTSEFYLVVPQTSYSTNYDYYVCFYNDSVSDGKWVKFEFSTYVSSGRTRYYGLLGNVPSSYSNFVINIVNQGQTPDGETYVSTSDEGTFNTNMNAVFLTVSSDSISYEWVNLTSSTSSNSEKTVYSSKGIKAGNSINIEAGTIVVNSNDDAFHSDTATLENGSTGLGDINVSGGTIQVTASDDAFHAESNLNISGGYINILDSHEGLEANVINVSGGSTYVYANDDGVNACSGSSTPLLNITGGYLDVTTPQGDTDGLDSNGNITISGGFTLVKGGSSSGMMAGSVDVDGTITVTGGTIVALGGICSTPSNSKVNTYISSGTSFGQGDYSLVDSSNNEILSFTLTSSYSSIWISSTSLSLNETYTILCGSTSVVSWTQSSTTVGSSGSSWFQGGR